MVMLAQIWTVLKGARESMAHIGFRTPPPVLPLTERGGSRIGYKSGADLDDSQSSAQIGGAHWIPDPPLRSAFNGRGGVQNRE